ncbi:hypothetical protein L226DRAFT_219273 [Lentinus tigrinus ALCF2SS1-7]|uniref:uncharacterized protein n=1 Tax=Lentinus tigrinus ALCF2SS1-7 TaxID=1328758 RepID=UPI00116615C2|nr:hypothetical protein L226DRAFT_219273 [Lentinus tigrinus ALCF2SS1-7]
MPASAHLGIRALSCLRFILSRHHHHRFIACTQPRTYSTQVVHLICSPSIILLALRTSPPPGAMVQAITATTPRVSPLLVCGACDAPPPVKLSTPRTFLSTIFFGGHRSTSPHQDNNLRRRVRTSAWSPQQKHETRSSTAESSTFRHRLVPACTMLSRIRKSAQQYSCSSLYLFPLSDSSPLFTLDSLKSLPCAGSSTTAIATWTCAPAPQLAHRSPQKCEDATLDHKHLSLASATGHDDLSDFLLAPRRSWVEDGVVLRRNLADLSRGFRSWIATVYISAHAASTITMSMQSIPRSLGLLLCPPDVSAMN